MIPKALLTAATDPELRPLDLHVYVFLHAHLDYLRHRPIKHTWLVRHLQMSRAHLSHAISRLLKGGYLERENDRNHRGRAASYRLPYSPPDP